jgi:hypothetical protein
MKLRRKALLISLTAVGALGLIGAAPAAAMPIWNLDIHHNETNFPAGGSAEYSFDISNIGDTDTSGPITLSLQLPAGVTRDSLRIESEGNNSHDGNTLVWSCPGSPGDTTVTCTTSSSLRRHQNERDIMVVVDIAPDAGPELTATATVAGGGAPEAPPAANCPPGVGACASEPTHVGSEVPPFGVAPGSWVADFYQADGVTPVRRAGSHPDLATFSFDFNSVPFGIGSNGEEQKAAVGSVRHVTVDLPPGFVGNPSAVGECTAAQLSTGNCPASSLVGRADLTVFPPTTTTRYHFSTPVYSMAHPKGVVADLAFPVLARPVHVKVTLDPANGYAIRSTAADVIETLRPFSTKVTIWGLPADSSHDSDLEVEGSLEGRGPAGHVVEPFLTLPSRCDVDNRMTFSRYDSWQQSGVFGPDVFYDMPGRITDCDKPRFEPDVSLEPTGKQATTPTGLDVNVHIPQNDNPNGVSTPPIKSTTVTLPKGMVISPAFADGLAGCSEAQIGLGTNDPVACPGNSRIGEVELSTPLLPKPIEGSLYLAKQGENPFGSLLAMYLAVHDTEERGILVKIPAKIDLDPVSGQITTTLDDLPQFPFEELTLKFRSGPRAPLTNPPTCGTHTIAVQMASYAQPNNPVDVSNTYQVNEGPGGGTCQNAPNLRPFDPDLIGGTLNPLAGAFSPMSLRVSRNDSEQEIARAEGIAPEGLTASLRGVGRCSEAQIAAALARSQPGQGAQELASPSCPANAQVGSVEVGVGAGQGLIYVPGKIYLAGPYKGAPLSGVAVVPAIAGPVDLGNVVVRAPTYVDPETAQVRLKTDDLPQIVHGVIVRVRDIRVKLDRPNFMLNPTDCSPKSINARLFSTEGATKFASNRFQVGDCASLGFKPKLALTLKGGTKRGDTPAFKAVLTARKGDANIGRAQVTLPHSEFLEQAHIGTVCTRVQFKAGETPGEKCPAASVYGYAKAITPLLDEPLQGPVYLRSSSHPLPDLVAALNSGNIDIALAGRIDSVQNGRIRNTFEAVPDAPVTKFTLEMKGGKKGLLVNSTNLCKHTNRAIADFTGQNGKKHVFNPVLKAQGCSKAKKKAKGKGDRKEKRSSARRILSSW